MSNFTRAEDHSSPSEGPQAEHTSSEPKTQFESIKQVNPYGAEYWSARELAPLLGYERWDRFYETIQRAIEICAIAGIDHEQHFPDHRIAVECDEEGHKRYTAHDEQLRQRQIEHALGCRFVRFNPDDPAVNLGDVINQIMLLIYERPNPSI